MKEKGIYDAVVGDKTFCITKDMISKVRGSSFFIMKTAE